MRVFKNRWFAKYAEREGLSDTALWQAVNQANDGLVAADLGGGVIKQRIAKQGQGKSGGYRTIIAFKRGDKAFFMYGFAKNVLDNVDNKDLSRFKQYAQAILKFSEEDLKILINEGEFMEVLNEPRH